MSMSTFPTRRFTLLDGMIVVGSIALGLAPIRWIAPGEESWEILKSMFSLFAWDMNYIDQIIPELLILVVPMAVTISLGVLAMRLRQPRPRWRRLVRQPGVVAALAVILGMLVAGAFLFVNIYSSVLNRVAFDPVDWYEPFSVCLPAMAGFAIVVAWCTQRLVGRWRPEPTWLDRLGRLIGVAWIASSFVLAYAVRNVLLGL